MIPVRIDSWKKARFTKGSVASPIADMKGIQTILNVGAWANDADGVGTVTSASSGLMFSMGGAFPNLHMIADLKFITPTIQGGEDICAVLHWGSNVNAADRNYVLIQQASGVFRIRKVVGGVVTTLATVAHVASQNTWYQFEAYRLRETVRARINAGAWLEATCLEADVPYMGNFGIRTGLTNSSTIKNRLVELEAWM